MTCFLVFIEYEYLLISQKIRYFTIHGPLKSP